MKFTTTILAVLLTAFAHATTTYYVNSKLSFPRQTIFDGSITYPWQTIAQVNAFTNFVDGDIILFARGNSYYGSLLIQKNNMTIGAYGTGAKPVITGFTTINKWYQNDLTRPHVWSAFLTAAPANYKLAFVLSVNGFSPGYGNITLPLGRYPNPTDANGGFLPFTGGSSTSITIPSALDPKWAGADICVKKRVHILERNTALSIVNGTTLNFSAGYAINPVPYFLSDVNEGRGYFIENSIETLDQDGEWYYEPTSKRVSIYCSSNSVNPIDGSSFALGLQQVKLSTIDRLIDLNSKNGISISDIKFEAANQFGIYGSSDPTGNAKITGINISSCDFNAMGARAIGLFGARASTINNCTFNWCLSTAITIGVAGNNLKSTNCAISNCTITVTAPYPGMAGYNNLGDFSAIDVTNLDTLTIEYNSINNVAKAGIQWQGNNVTIQKNAIQNAVTQFTDFGAIYTYMNYLQAPLTNRTISNNVIWDCQGNADGTNISPDKINVKGIYLDDRTTNVTVANNTVYNIRGTGIAANHPVSNVISYNTLFNNQRALAFAKKYGSDFTPPNPLIMSLTVNNNIFYSNDATHENVHYNNSNLTTTLAADLLNFCDFHDNHYGEVNPVPFIQEAYINASLPLINSSPMNLAVWKYLSNKDASSAVIAPVKLYTITTSLSNNLVLGGGNGTFDNNGSLTSIYTNPNHTADANATAITTGWDAGSQSLICTINNPIPNKNPAIWGDLNTTNIFNSKNYIFKCTTRGSLNNGVARGIMNTFIAKWGAIGALLVPAKQVQTFDASATPVLHEFLFSHPTEYNGATRFGIELEGYSGSPTYIDNIQLFEVDDADITRYNVDDIVKFNANPGNTPMPVILPTGTYKDVYGTIYTCDGTNSCITVQPYSSMLLFLQQPAARPADAAAPVAAAENKTLLSYPNPVGNILTISNLSNSDDWQYISITNIKGEQVVAAKQVAGENKIAINVASLPAGQYMAVLKNKAGKSLTSKFVKL